jgi:hypothetical protein
MDRQNQTTNNKGSDTNNNLPENANGTTAEVNTYCSLKGKPRNHILLATRIVVVKHKSGQYVPCRDLFDSVSNRIS